MQVSTYPPRESVVASPVVLRGDDATLDVALAVPLSGPAGMFGPSCEASAELAVADVNAAGGILDRPVRVHLVDAGAPLNRLSDTVDRLVTTGHVESVIGWHLSNARNVITPHTAGRVPYVYTTFYEGGEDADGVYMVGETPDQQLFPAIRWLRANRGIRRWCVIGNDYVWPRATSARTRDFLHGAHMDFLGDHFVPRRGRDFGSALQMIADTRPDGVLVLMVGADAAAFHRAFAAAGLDEQHIRLSMMIGEDVLCGCGAEATHDLYTACGYFESVVTPEGLEFGSRYERRFGRSAPGLNNIGESCYEGLMLLAALARAAGSLDTATIGRTTRGVTYRGPRGEVELCGRHTRQPVYLAQADHLAFDVITELTA
ncbi:ABC transporter substrate-binding protein [Gordonia polyisoprenivorans]|uniref:ABC transporter substrate-binding protein n=1 Tax=Gordonia polyisoprenivorans TaxID=84595 RepID=A0A846WSY1_9ACTN|nr:ABC transporter substrate-binding protein [Gordonia polyisoprenivorans]